MTSSCLLLSDTHLSRDHGHDTGIALATLVRDHADKEIVLAGDVFDLSLDTAEVPIAQSAESVIAAHVELAVALRGHLAQGGKLTLVPGNHDAALSADAGILALRRILQPQSDEQLEIAPWFTRRGAVHIEHGHLYDRDCAPNHPLADPNPRSEGLGTAMMRRFVAPNDAIFFAHAHKTTPVSGIRTTFAKWGLGAPLVIARYFGTAFALCAESAVGKSERNRDRAVGTSRLPEHATHNGHELKTLEELISMAPVPTHDDFHRTFLRLYFDRIFAGVSLGLGLSALAAAGLGVAASLPMTTTSAALLSAVGGGYLGQSLLRERNRYGHGPSDAVGAAAKRVRDITGSRLVVLGHTHVEVDEPGYVNLGSFAFGDTARPYLLLDDHGRSERRFAPLR